MNAATFWTNNLSSEEQKKLAADPFYSSMVAAGYDYASLQRSGWINHAYSFEQMQQVRKQTVTQFAKKDVFILLNTGSYAPAHEGHIEQLNVARDWVKTHYPKSHPVMCLSPSHDKYVLTKSEDILPWNINTRVDRLYELMSNSKFSHEELVLDLWESVICEYPVNFTDVILKFAQDLEQLNINFKIGYVFGSDNEEFLLPFAHLPLALKTQYFAFCVERKGFPLHLHHSSENVIYLKTEEQYNHLSSRHLRRATSINQKAFYTFDETTSFYAIRKDSALALKMWQKTYPSQREALEASYEHFHTGLCEVIEAFTQKPVKSIDLKTQQYLAQEIANKTALLNLDMGTNENAGFALDYTRTFTLASDQRKPNALVARPEAQKQMFVAGTYAFMDDDIASGKTFELISEKLKTKGIIFSEKYNLAKMFCEYKNWTYNLFDIIDTKDFLFGAYSGGLLCETYQGNIRLPYFMHFINLYTRASIKPSQWLMFQKEIDRLNGEFFKQHNYLTHHDINPELSTFLGVKGSLENWVKSR